MQRVKRRARRGPEVRQSAASAASRVEEHHRRGLLGRAALEHVQPLDGLRVPGIARQPVHRVGGEQRDSARRDAGIDSAPPTRPAHRRPRPHDPLDAGEVAQALDAREARASQQRRHRIGLALPHLERRRTAPTSGSSRDQPADQIEPVGAPAVQRSGGLVPGDLGRPAPRPVRDVGQVRQHCVRSQLRREEVGLEEADVGRPQPRRVGPRDRERVGADVDPDHAPGPGARRRARARPRRSRCRRRRPSVPAAERSAGLDQQLGLRARDQHPRVDGQLSSRNHRRPRM